MPFTPLQLNNTGGTETNNTNNSSFVPFNPQTKSFDTPNGLANSGTPQQVTSQPSSLSPRTGGNGNLTSPSRSLSDLGNTLKSDAKGFLSKVGNLFSGNAQRFGETVGQSVTAPQNANLYDQALQAHTQTINNLQQGIKNLQAEGKDTSKLESVLQGLQQNTPKLEDFTGEVINKTPEQVIGEGIGTGLEALSGGLLETGGSSLLSNELSTGQKLLKGAKIGATFGGVGSASNAMQNNASTGNVALNTAIGAGTGALIGAGTEGLVAGLQGASKLAKNLTNPSEEAVRKAQTDYAKAYETTLNLTPTQKAKEASLLTKTGDNIYTTAVKNGFRLGTEEAPKQIQSALDTYSTIIDNAQKNEHALFNLDEILKNTDSQINERVSSASARTLGKDKVAKEIEALIAENPNAITTGANGERLVDADFVDRLRKTGNSWTPYNASDPEKVGQSVGFSLADSVRNQVEKQGTFPAYREAMREWGKIIHLNDVIGGLENSNKKMFKVPGGLSGSITRKVLSGALGYHTGGLSGLILGEMGAQYGAEIMGNPELRSYFNRKIIEAGGATDTRAVTRLSQEIKDYIDAKTKQKLLPPPSYVPMGARTPKPSSVEMIPAQKNPTTMNPTTGRFQRSYSSTPYANVENAPISTQTNIKNNSIPASKPLVENKSSLLSTAKKNLKNNGQAGHVELLKPYKETSNLTTKILKDLEGKTTVSKQYILDATNRGELKQAERDITRQVLDTMPDGQINVKEFADKVKAELLPLKVKNSDLYTPEGKGKNAFKMVEEGNFTPKYENISLPDDVRGNVAHYKENIYESPIATSAGDTHFNYHTKNYFGHTRIEDMADNKTRRVIEVQSDLYQKGGLENEVTNNDTIILRKLGLENEYGDLLSSASGGKKLSPEKYQRALDIEKQMKDFKSNEQAKIKPLQQYNDPTAHFRMIREEIKKASQDGKTKLQFPTGETAMKIEGLGQESRGWVLPDEPLQTMNRGYPQLDQTNLKVGLKVRNDYQDWIITDVLGDGKFKAIQKSGADNFNFETKKYEPSSLEEILKYAKSEDGQSYVETFDISGKVDTNNPIYKFYEKDVQKYLNKFGGKRVVDDKGVSWIEIPITKEMGKAPVEAFGKAQLGAVSKIGLATGAVSGGLLLKKKMDSVDKNKKLLKQ